MGPLAHRSGKEAVPLENQPLTYSSRSLFAFGLLLTLTQLFHPVIGLILERGITAAWLLMLLGAAFTVLMAWPVAAALGRRPGADLIDLAQAAFGPAGRLGCAVAFAITLVFLCGLILRETSEMALTTAFPHTPQTFIIVALLVTALFVAWGDGSSLVRLGSILVPGLVAGTLFALAMAMPWGHPYLLAPFLGPGLPRLALAAPLASIMFVPLLLVYALAGGVHRSESLGGWILAVPAIAALPLALAKAVLASVYPYPVGITIIFPVHALARLVVGGRFFERVDSVWLYLWASCTATMTGALLWGAAMAMARAFGVRRHTHLLPPLGVAALVVGYFTPSQVDAVTLHEVSAPALVAVTLGLPALIALVANWRGRRSGYGQ